MAEVVEIFGVRFTGQRDTATGRIYVPLTPESKAGLAALGRVGLEMKRVEPVRPVSCAVPAGSSAQSSGAANP